MSPLFLVHELDCLHATVLRIYIDFLHYILIQCDLISFVKPYSSPLMTMSDISDTVRLWVASTTGPNSAGKLSMNPPERPGARSTTASIPPSPSSTESSVENRQRYSELISLGSLTARQLAFKDLAGNVEHFDLIHHRRFWPVLDDLTEQNASVESRESAFLYLKSVAALPDLTQGDFSTLHTLIKKPVAASLVYQQVEAFEALLAHRKYSDVVRDGFTEYILSVLKRQYDFVAGKRRELRVQQVESLQSEVYGLDALLAFSLHLVSAGPKFISQGLIEDLVRELLTLADSANFERDLKGVLKVLEALTKLKQIPAAQLKAAIALFCGVLSLNGDLQGIAERCLAQICRMSADENVVEILLEIVNEAPAGREVKRVRGAFSRLVKLYRQNGVDRSLRVPFDALMHSIDTVCLIGEKYQRDSLEFFRQLFCEEDFRHHILQEDWNELFRVLTVVITKPPPGLAADAVKDAYHTAASSPSKTLPLSKATDSASIANIKLDEWQRFRDTQVRAIASGLEALYPQVETNKKKHICVFYLITTLSLPDMASADIIDSFLYDSTTSIRFNQAKTLEALVTNTDYSPERRAEILERLCEALVNRPNTAINNPSITSPDRLRKLVSSLLPALPQIDNVRLINAIAVLVTTFARIAELKDVDSTVRTLIAYVDYGEPSQATSESLVYQAPSNTITMSLVRLFQVYMTASAEKAVLLYNILVNLSINTEHSSPARLSAMKLLTRLRCIQPSSTATSASLSRASSTETPSLPDAIVAVAVHDILGLAAYLCRTEETKSGMHRKVDVSDLASAIEQPRTRTGRASNINSPSASRSETRSASGQTRGLGATRLLWIYPGRKGLPIDPPSTPNVVLQLGTSGSDPNTTLRLEVWVEVIIRILKDPGDWEIYSYILVHLPSQLSNPLLFANCLSQIRSLRNVIVTQLRNGTFHEPPPSSGVKKDSVALCLIHCLKMLMAYRNFFSTSEQEEVVKLFLILQGQFDRVAKTCIQALTICCYEVPRAVARCLDDILQKMAQMITKAHLAMDVLEFLRCLASLAHLHTDLTETQIRMVYVICITHLEQSREQRDKLLRTSAPSAPGQKQNRQSTTSQGSESSHKVEVHKKLPQYIYALAYHVMVDWFLALKLADRPKYVGWITSRLWSTDTKGDIVMEPQSQVMLDMMLRTTYLNLGETKPSPSPNPEDGIVLKKSWIVGLSIVTVETAARTGRTEVTTRQASGTTHALYIRNTAPLPTHHIPMELDAEDSINIYPSHVFLQQHSTIAPTPVPMEPICLPDNEQVQRAISVFDRNDTVDGYKVGVIYVGNGQHMEAEILANTSHSSGFDELLKGLGTKVPLQGAQFNTQGLDRRYGSDGEYTYAWRNRVVEIVFHVPTMMPTNLDSDPQCVSKKAHIGNNHVSIIYNESGLPFAFNTFAGQFNHINIVVTPDGFFLPEEEPDEQLETSHRADPSVSMLSAMFQGRLRYDSAAAATSSAQQMTSRPSTFPPSNPLEDPLPTTAPPLEKTFRVQTLIHPSFPLVTPTHTTKVVSASALGPLVRHIALNATVFSKAWAAREHGEIPSSWCQRLNEIYKLRERYNQSENVSATGTAAPEDGKAERSKSSGIFPGLGFFSKKGKEREETQFTGIKAEKKYIEGDKWIGEVRMGGLTEEEGVKSGLDFSRWAGENPKVEKASKTEELGALGKTEG